MARFRRRGYGRIRRFKRRGSRFGRRRYYRRKAYGRRSGLRKKIQSVVSRNIETKEFAFTTVSIWGNITTTWTEAALSIDTLTQGVQQGQYIGKSIFVKSVTIWGWIKGAQAPDHAADSPFNFIRIIIARWNGEAGVLPLTGLGAHLNDRINKSVDPTYRGMIKKYYDRLILFKNGNLSEQAEGVLTSYGFAHKFIKKRVIFRGRGLRMDRIIPSSRIIISCLSDEATAPFPGFNYGWCVMKYKDA